MTAGRVELWATETTRGCVGCGSQRTVILCPSRGRLCPSCMTIPAGPFRSDLAADMVELGRIDAAFRYLGGWLARETAARFDAAIRAVAG